MPSGSCQCCAITYRVDGEPLMTYACHCSDCQKANRQRLFHGFRISGHSVAEAAPVYATQPDNMMELLTAAMAYRATLQS